MKERFYTYSTFPLKSIGIFLFLLNTFSIFSQTSEAADIMVPPANGFRCRAEIVGRDTFPLVFFDAVDIVTNFVYSNKRQHEQWTRTKYNVKVVYPYAILAAAKLKEYDKALEKMQNESLKKAFIKVCEKDLRSQFEEELKGMTVSQGKILMKLIDREANKTTYEIVKQLRGRFQAAMWQTVALIFGHNMKVEYDAQVEDLMIERAVKLVEAGQF